MIKSILRCTALVALATLSIIFLVCVPTQDSSVLLWVLTFMATKVAALVCFVALLALLIWWQQDRYISRLFDLVRED